MVEDHGHIATEIFLDLNRAFRRQLEQAPIDMGSKGSSLLSDFGSLSANEKNLEAATIRKNRAVPHHELVKTA